MMAVCLCLDQLPKLAVSMEAAKGYEHIRRSAYEVMKLFLADFTEGELKGLH